MTQALPMFPLGSVLLPGMVLPLHVFEERYRALVEVVLAQPEPVFGVTLIERGSEVGGGDVRAAVGCVARVVEAAQTPDGRWALVAVGTDRLQVVEWLPDDPYPRAQVELLPDPVVDDALLSGALGPVEAQVRHVAGLAARLGAPPLPDDLELAEDLVLRLYQLAVLSPLGALDRQRVLVCEGPLLRAAVLGELLVEQEDLLRAELEGPGAGPG
ncbi:MAG: LON peptidase substrate-binding domain-containing protein [Actinomycetes bacterium]